jgi:dihydrodipicolinate synthase/N-acetylneuraminate lyase
MARAARELKLAGVFASCITPRRIGSQDPDFSGLLDLLDFLAEGGVTGVSLFDQTGEFLNYSFAERQRLLYLGAKRSRVPLLCGVSHSTFDGALQLADEAISSGADGLMIMAPYFYRYSQRELETFFVEFARETGDAVPILIQNLPEATSTLEFDLMRRLIETGRFAGINDSSGDWNLFESLIQLKRQMPFALLAGSDRLAARALREGADGIVSAAACAVPDLMTRLPQASNVLTDFLDRSEKFPFPVAIKRAVEIRGQKSAPPLTPLAPENEAALNEFSAWFKGWLPQMRKAAAVV